MVAFGLELLVVLTFGTNRSANVFHHVQSNEWANHKLHCQIHAGNRWVMVGKRMGRRTF